MHRQAHVGRTRHDIRGRVIEKVVSRGPPAVACDNHPLAPASYTSSCRADIRHRAVQTCALPLPLAYFAILICYWRVALAHPAATADPLLHTRRIRYSILDASKPLLHLISPTQSQIRSHGARPKYKHAPRCVRIIR